MKIKRLQFGVTLIELLIIIAIVVIMAAAVFVVRKPAEDKGKIELTKATIELLCAAIEQYHNFYNEFPDVKSTDSTYFGGNILNDYEKLTYRLSLCPDAVAVLNQINSKMITQDKGINDDYVEYIDAWGMEFRYEYDKDEKWNFPLITSAGADKDFTTKEDNITSKN